jgi:putative transposase
VPDPQPHSGPIRHRLRRPPSPQLRPLAGDLYAVLGNFPDRHWKKIQSTNLLERINREGKRRADVVQVFPNSGALERLTTAVLFEMHDEWIAFPRRYLPEGSMNEIYPEEHAPTELPAQRRDQLGTATPPQGT